MAYTIIRSDGSVLTVIPDSVVNTTSSPLALPGRNYPGYGQVIDTNQVHQLENFASPTPPANALRGQLWFNPTTNLVYVCPADGETDPNEWFELVSANVPRDIHANSIIVDNEVTSTDVTVTSLLTSEDIVANNIQSNTLQVLGNASINDANLVGTTTANAIVTTVISSGANSTPGTVTGRWTITGTGNALTVDSGNIAFSSNTVGIKSDNYMYANGAPVSFDGTYTNSNVDAYLPTYNGNVGASFSGTAFNGNVLSTGNADTTGTITGNWTLSPGSTLNGVVISGSVSNATYANNAGHATTANVAVTVSGNAQPNITSVGTLTSLNSTGTISGNILSGKHAGDGGLLSNINAANIVGNTPSAIWASTADHSNTAITVTANAQPNITSLGILSSITVTGNVNSGNLVASGTVQGAVLSGPLSTATQPNITSVGNLTSLNVVGNINAGNVIATHYGSGAGLTSIPGANVTGTVANATTAVTSGTVTTAAQPNITSVGSLTSLVVTGNINAGNVTATRLGGALTTNAQPNITSVGTLTSLSVAGNVSGSNFTGNHIGNGSGLTNIPGANVVGIVANATTANIAVNVSGNAQPNITTVGTLGNLSVTGNVVAARLTGSLTTNSQPNITTIGTLGNLIVSGNVTSNNIIANSFANSTGVTNLTTANVGNITASFFIDAGGHSIGEFSPDATMSANSNSKLSTQAAIVSFVKSYVAAQLALMPKVEVSTVFWVASELAPAGTLICDGGLYSTTTYAALFAKIGYKFGGSGGNFRVPDLRGEFIRGWDAGRGKDPGRAFGTTQATQNLAHIHTGNAVTAGGHSHTLNGGYSMSQFGWDGGDYGSHAGASISPNTSFAGDHTHTIDIDSSGGTESRPTNVALLPVIKY